MTDLLVYTETLWDLNTRGEKSSYLSITLKKPKTLVFMRNKYGFMGDTVTENCVSRFWTISLWLSVLRNY